MKNSALSIISLVALMCALSLGIALTGCKETGVQPGDAPPSVSEGVQQLTTQMPGVIDSVNDIIQADPNVGKDIKDHVAGYTAMAKDASQIVGAVAGIKSPEQLAGSVTAIANLVQDVPLPPDAKNQVGNYLGWAGLLLKLAGVVIPLFVELGKAGLAFLLLA